MKVTQLNGSTISKAHGVSVISKPDLLDVNRKSRSWGWPLRGRDAGLAVPLAGSTRRPASFASFG